MSGKTITVNTQNTGNQNLAFKMQPLQAASVADGCEVNIEGLFIVDPETGDKYGTSITLTISAPSCSAV